MSTTSPFKIREVLFSATRNYFQSIGFHEVDTPVLQPSLPLEPNIYSFSVSWPYLKHNLLLTTSPESILKHYLASGLGNCFSLAKCFRNLESPGPTHNPEFTMLEWYELHQNDIGLMGSVEKYILYIIGCLGNKRYNRTTNSLTYLGKKHNLSLPWPRLTMSELFSDFAHINLDENLTRDCLAKTAKSKGYHVQPNDTWESTFNQIFLNEIEPRLPVDRPLFITGYPAFISPLCRPSPQNPNYSERFELYLGGMEIANGCTENTDAKLIKENFDAEKIYRQRASLPYHTADSSFVLNSSKLPPCAGVGLGIDRLSMILSDLTNINDISKL